MFALDKGNIETDKNDADFLAKQRSQVEISDEPP